jgi:acetaldehyde dehydrogenase
VSITRVAVIGSGNIGTDLMMKILRTPTLQMTAMVGIDAASDGLARARKHGVATTADGVHGLIGLPCFDDIGIVFDATSASAHLANASALAPYGKRLLDLTPAAIGPFVIPAVNLEQHLDAPNMNMVTCGGQATIPIASKSAGPGTRANIDEFTETTARAIEVVGRASRGKAIIVLNPAEPPLIMRDTVSCLIGAADHAAIRDSVESMVAEVAGYVPGYRLKQRVQIMAAQPGEPLHTLLPEGAGSPQYKVSVYLEVEGAAQYLPAYAGNLDIMTSAAVRVATRLAEQRVAEVVR